MPKQKRKLIEKLRNKEYRDSYVENAITVGLPFQIRALREDRGWTQEQLADRMDKTQTLVSRLENGSYGRFSLTTLRELASAFDVALLVKFVPFSKFIEEVEDRSPKGLAAQSFEAELPTLQARLNIESCFSLMVTSFGVTSAPCAKQSVTAIENLAATQPPGYTMWPVREKQLPRFQIKMPGAQGK